MTSKRGHDVDAGVELRPLDRRLDHLEALVAARLGEVGLGLERDHALEVTELGRTSSQKVP